MYPGRIMLRPRQRRHTLRWIASAVPGYLLRRPSPWITFDAIDHLDRRIRPGWRVFEYGSGGSTLYWLSRGAECVSVEHDADWHARLRLRLPAGARIEYRLVPPAPADGGDTAADQDDPAAYRSSWEAYRGQSFRAYASQIDEFPAGHFDLVVVDGRARPSCIRHAVPKVRPGGILLVDNADRSRYFRHTGRELAEGFRRLSFPGVCPAMAHSSRTDLFVRNPAD